MIVKSVIAGTIMSLMAGGVVYYGTDIDVQKNILAKPIQSSEAKIATPDATPETNLEHPHGIDETIPKGEGGSEIIEATVEGKTLAGEKLSVKTSETTQDKDAMTSETPKSGKWIDQYIKQPSEAAADTKADANSKDSAAHGSGSDYAQGEVTEAEAALKSMETETAEMDAAKTEMAAMVEDKAESEMPKDSIPEDNVPEDSQSEESMPDDSMKEAAITEPKEAMAEAEVEAEPTRSFRGNRINNRSRRDGDRNNRQSGRSSISSTVEVIMGEAAKIEMPELRDRAYLELVDFALDHKDFDAARKALIEIEQVELRDTARNRMAVSFAQNNQTEEAFAALEELEVDALRDVIRLQVIEAIIAPESLPKEFR